MSFKVMQIKTKRCCYVPLERLKSKTFEIAVTGKDMEQQELYYALPLGMQNPIVTLENSLEGSYKTDQNLITSSHNPSPRLFTQLT